MPDIGAYLALAALVPTWADVRHLPGYTSAENPNVIDRWKAAGMAPPE